MRAGRAAGLLGLLAALLAAGCGGGGAAGAAPGGPAPAVPADPGRARLADAVAAAKAREGAGDGAAAEAAWEEVLRMRPDHASALYASARLRWARGDAAGALDRLALLRAAEPGGGRGFLLAAEIHSDPRSGPLRDPARAVALAARAVELNPEESGTHLGLGRALLAAGRLPEAGERLPVAARMNPRDAESRSLLGVLDLRAGDRERAGARFREALRCAAGTGVGGAAGGPPGEGDTLADLDPGRAPGPGELRALAGLHLLGTPLRGAREGAPPPGARERCGADLEGRGTGEALLDLDGDGRVDAAAVGGRDAFAAAILAPGGGVLLLR